MSSAGTLELGVPQSFGGGAITIDSGATFDIGDAAFTLSTSALNGAGTLNAGKGGNLTLNAVAPSSFGGSIAEKLRQFHQRLTPSDFHAHWTSNNFTGTLNVNAGKLILGGASGTITSTGTVTVNAPGSLVFNHDGTAGLTTFGAQVTGTGTVVQQGAGATTLTGLISGVSVTNLGGVAGCAFTLTNAGALGTVTNAGTTTITGGTLGSATVAAIINTGGTLTVSSNVSDCGRHHEGHRRTSAPATTIWWRRLAGARWRTAPPSPSTAAR